MTVRTLKISMSKNSQGNEAPKEFSSIKTGVYVTNSYINARCKAPAPHL